MLPSWPGPFYAIRFPSLRFPSPPSLLFLLLHPSRQSPLNSSQSLSVPVPCQSLSSLIPRPCPAPGLSPLSWHTPDTPAQEDSTPHGPRHLAIIDKEISPPPPPPVFFWSSHGSDLHPTILASTATLSPQPVIDRPGRPKIYTRPLSPHACNYKTRDDTPAYLSWSSAVLRSP